MSARSFSVQKKAYQFLLVSILLLMGWLTFRVPLLKGMGQFLVVSQPPMQADLIVVLAGGTGERCRYGAKLYQQGFAPQVLLSGGPLFLDMTETDVMANYMVSLGVPRDGLILERRSTSTYENALYSALLLRERGSKRVLLVTSSFHMRRSYRVFQKMLQADGIDVIPCPVPDQQASFSLQRWWEEKLGVESVLMEYAKLGWYLLRGWV